MKQIVRHKLNPTHPYRFFLFDLVLSWLVLSYSDLILFLPHTILPCLVLSFRIDGEVLRSMNEQAVSFRHTNVVLSQPFFCLVFADLAVSSFCILVIALSYFVLEV